MKLSNKLIVGLASVLLCHTYAYAQQGAFYKEKFPLKHWTLAEFGPSLPSDWSPYKSLDFEVRESTPQRFFFVLHTTLGVRKIRIQPYGSNVWSRIVIPLAYFERQPQDGYDIASVGNKYRESFWMTPQKPLGPIGTVTDIGIELVDPVGHPEIEIRSPHVSKEIPTAKILNAGPVIDQFGQWSIGDWPRKVHSLDQLKKEWKTEETQLRPIKALYGRYGGYIGTRRKSTGFFRVEQIDKRWWFIDPDGHLYLLTSANVMSPVAGTTSTANRKEIFEAIPPADVLGNSESDHASFLTWNLYRRFGTDWRAKWIDLSSRRMDAWGLNAIGNWSDQSFMDSHRKPYLLPLHDLGIEKGFMGMPDVYADDFEASVDAAMARQCEPRKADPWLVGYFMGMPDVYADDFEASVDAAITSQCEPRKADPWLVGYFIGNEPPWPGRELDLMQLLLLHPETAIGRNARVYLEKDDTPARRKEFIYTSFTKELSIVNASLKRHDPNHLNLGLRFGSGLQPKEVMQAARTFDVYSFNAYDYSVPQATLDAIYEQTGRPLFIGEFHNGVAGDGLGSGLVPVRTQEERGSVYRSYIEQAASHPAMIGFSWFAWSDEPATGRGDGENYNIGFVDVTDRPYKPLVDAIRLTSLDLRSVHGGTRKPFVAPNPADSPR